MDQEKKGPALQLEKREIKLVSSDTADTASAEDAEPPGRPEAAPTEIKSVSLTEQIAFQDSSNRTSEDHETDDETAAKTLDTDYSTSGASESSSLAHEKAAAAAAAAAVAASSPDSGESPPSAEGAEGKAENDLLSPESAVSLRQILDREAQPISRKQTLALMIALCDHLIARRVPHGELTPNIIALIGSEVVIDDSLGTGWLDPLYSYKAPESFKGKVDQRTDVYSLGVILFEMLRNGTPNPVQKGGGRTALSKNQLSESSSWIKIHPELKNIIQKCVNTNPAARYKTAAKLKQALLTAAQSNTVVLPPAPKPSAFPAVANCVALAIAGLALYHYVVPLVSPTHNSRSFYSDLGPTDRNVRHSDVVISDSEKALLAAYNLVVIVDKSGSMAAPDCASDNSQSKNAKGNTRWDWTENELENLAKQTQVVMPNGLSLVTFDTTSQSFANCKIKDIGELYKNNPPNGGSDLGPALGLAMQQKFPLQKPLLIAVISDCQISDESEVQQQLLEAVNKEKTKVAFFRVGGQDEAGEALLSNLREYVKANSKNHANLRTVSFPEFSKLGLAKAFTDSVK